MQKGLRHLRSFNFAPVADVQSIVQVIMQDNRGFMWFGTL